MAQNYVSLHRKGANHMTHINVKISKAVATVEKDGIITTGMVGVPVSFMFDSWWDGLMVTAVFKGSGAPISVPLLGATETVVPWEVLKRPSTLLRIGAEGRLPDGTLVIPTTWATVGIVMSGANATDDLAKPPTPTAFDRIMSQIGNMNDLATEDKSSLVAAVNEAMKNGGGTVDPEAVQKIVDAYLAENPPAPGADGKDGADGITPTIGENGNWYLGDTDTGKPSRGEKGDEGQPGKDGQDGSPGKDGNDGQPGKDGTSPVISVSAITGGHRITITDANGTKTVDVMDGSDGKNGADGQPGADGSPGQDGQPGSDGKPGENGADGYSPTANVTQNDNGATITITDKNGTTTATVTNGKDGVDGNPGADGSPGADGADGKSAYQYAQDDGYTGTEAEFAAKLAEEIPEVDATLTQSGQAADAAAVGDRLSALSEEIVTTSKSKVAAHNTGTDTHSDIRLLIQGLTDRLNALADSDDTTLDQLSEVVAYIKSNRSLIEAITTSKVSAADIVDNLTTNVTNKPLSAAQGVVIKTLIDALRNDKLDAAELTNAVNAALAQAKASGEFDGADGKSAYAYAVEGGYTGTEAEFAAKLANECIDQTARDYAASANARIDLFTSLEAGSTTGDAELQDIRIGFDGKRYDSAGSAVRGQAEALKNSLDFMSEEEGEMTTTTVRNPEVTNLLDGVSLTNNMIVNASGAEIVSTNYSLTDYIPITYNHYLTYLRSTKNGYDAIGMVAFYDGNKNFIKRLSEYNGDVYTARVSYTQMASTNNVGYVRFCIGKNADAPSLIVTDGETSEKSLSDYNNYYITITEFEPTGRSVTKLKDGVVTPEKTSFLHKSRNVLDDSNLKFGFIESNGSISDSKFYKYTDKCAVTAGSTLRFRAGDTYQGVRKIAFYNGETLLNVLSYGGYSNYVRSCTVPATATHAVFCIGRAMDKKMVIEGDSYPDEMQEYGVFKLDSQQLPTPADYIHAKGIGINNGIPGGWCETQASDADLSLASTLDYTDYISGIDAIASVHSDYVTVTSPGNDATNTYQVKYYTLVPPGDRNYMRKPIPTVIIIGGIHGGESAGAYAVRTLFLDLCENYLKDDRLNYLHNNVRFVIFPVANPYGFGGTYKNGNGVNLNRNFGYGWDDASYESSDKLYGGASAFSEAETQYIKSVIDNNQNVLCVLDIHSNNDAALNNQWKYVNWLSMCTDIQSDALENAALNQIQGLTMRLYKMEKITEEDGVCGYTSHTSGQGMCKAYAASKGIWALTAECCTQLPSDTASYSKDVQRINAEMVENLVVNILRCASDASGR